MTFTDIVSEVILLSNRGDLTPRIQAAVRDMTLRCHRVDFFWRDFIEAKLTFLAAQTIVDINVVTYLQRFRQALYVRYYDPSTSIYGNMLTKIPPRDVLDDYNFEKLDRWYAAGDFLKLKFAIPTSGVQVGYYCYPVVYPYDQYASWIADQFPQILIKGALAEIYNQTGKQEEATALNRDIGFLIDPGRSASKGPTLVEQLRAIALEEDAR